MLPKERLFPVTDDDKMLAFKGSPAELAMSYYGREIVEEPHTATHVFGVLHIPDDVQVYDGSNATGYETAPVLDERGRETGYEDE